MVIRRTGFILISMGQLRFDPLFIITKLIKQGGGCSSKIMCCDILHNVLQGSINCSSWHHPAIIDTFKNVLLTASKLLLLEQELVNLFRHWHHMRSIFLG